MPYYTPLRYPGGKRRLAYAVGRLLDTNGLHDVEYVEPYAGGAAIALSLLFEERASIIHINDLSRPVFAFWHTVLNQTRELCDRIRHVKVTMREWHRQRSIYDQRETVELGDLGFASLFLNRTNRSGIINGGVIGGQKQTGKWLIGARFNKDELITRIRKIGRYANRIRLYQQDALHFAQNTIPNIGRNVFAFFDPPYIENGEDLYLNDYTIDDHRSMAQVISTLKQAWVVTYDFAATRYSLFQNRTLTYGLAYSAQERYSGKEVMFLSDGLKVPEEWRPSCRVELSAPKSTNPLYGIMGTVKPHPKIEEGPAAGDRFLKALKTVLSVPKDSVPSPFRKPKKKKNRRKS